MEIISGDYFRKFTCDVQNQAMAMNVASLTFLGAAKVVALAGIALAQDSCNSFSNRGNGCWCYTHGYRDSELVLSST